MNRTTSKFWSALAAAMTPLSYSAAAEPCFDLRDPDARIAACTQGVNSGKLTGAQQAIGYSNRGAAWHQNGDNDRAIADFNEAIRLDLTFAQPFFNRGLTWRDKRDPDPALTDYNEAMRLGLKDSAIFNSRGIAWFNKGDIDRAIGDFSEAVRLDPKNITSNRGATYHEKCDKDHAIADFSAAIRLDPKGRQGFQQPKYRL
jgi:tetratricopeptide (TPR) repeat protein